MGVHDKAGPVLVTGGTGLIGAHVVVPHARLLDETLSRARQIAANSPEGVSAAKQLILKNCDLDLRSAMKLSHALRNPMDGTAAAKEGIQAWADKRTFSLGPEPTLGGNVRQRRRWYAFTTTASRHSEM